MVRSTRYLHKNVEILIQEKGGATSDRTITFLTRPDEEAGAGSDSLQIILTNHGAWVPVAKWEGDRIRLLANVSREIVPALENVLARYLDQGSARSPAARRKRYFFVENAGAPGYSISPAHPYGLAVNVYSLKSLAKSEADQDREDEQDARVRQTSDLEGFLIKAADEGFAGAILDAKEPVYFCLDEKDHMIFLKLSLNEEEEVEESLLREDGTWILYEGEQEIEFFLDQDSFDGNMIKNLGEIPFLGHRDMDFAWTVEHGDRRGTPYVLAAEDGPFRGLPGGDAVLLFRTREHAMEFILERGLLNCEAVRVESVRPFLRDAMRNKRCVLLEPFNHRAASASMWLNGNSVILDSFSGFWVMGEDWAFERAV